MKKALVGLFILASLVSAETKASASKVIELSPGTSRVIKTNFHIRKAAIGNPDIADIVVSDKEIIVNSKKPGITTLTLWDDSKNYPYTILCTKGVASLYMKTYKVNNIRLMDYTADWNGVKKSVNTYNSDGIYKMLNNVLESNQFCVNFDLANVMVYGTDSDQRRAEEIINKLDAHAKLILFKAELYSVQLNNSFTDEFKVFQTRYNIKSADGSYSENTNMSVDAGGLSLGDNTADPASILPYTKAVSLFIRKLQEEGKAKVIANPQVKVLENCPAAISSGTKIPIIRFDKDGNSSTEYIDSGVNLSLVGNLDADNNIYCSTKVEYSYVAQWHQSSGPNGVISTAPEIAVRRATNSSIRLQNNQPFILGGLMMEEETLSSQKVPILGDLLGWIPLVGSIFKNEKKSKINSELIIAITPIIVDNESIPDVLPSTKG